MLKASEVEFFASIVNSLINRRPFLIEVDPERMSQSLRDVLSFVPAHRWILTAGAVPRWIKRLASQPRELPSDDKDELAQALVSTFEEERMGRRPVQFLYFGADPQIYETILKPLSRGWIAICQDGRSILEKTPSGCEWHMREGEGGIKVFHLGAEPVDLTFETRLLKKAVGRRKTCVTFLVQKKLAEMHLAAVAILNELEQTHGTFTLVDLEELFELDGFTVEKEFELVQAERDLDLRRYLTLPPAEITLALDSICKVPHVVGAAVVEKGQVVSLRRVKHTEAPISLLASHLGSLFEKFPAEAGLGGCCNLKMTCSEGEHVIAVKNNDRTYVVLFSGDTKLAMGAAELLDLLGRTAPAQ
jgi:hypothetical protein